MNLCGKFAHPIVPDVSDHNLRKYELNICEKSTNVASPVNYE